MKPDKIEDASMAELVTEALGDSRQLVRVEIELAMNELRRDLRAMRRAAIAFVVAMSAVTVALALFAVALVLALGGTASVAASVAGGFLVATATAGSIGYLAFPRHPLSETRARLESDVRTIKESMA